MSDKNPYYSIPKALGEPTIEIEMLPGSPDVAMLADLQMEIDRKILEAFSGGYKPPRPTALRVRGNSFETVYLDNSGNVIEPLRCTCGCHTIFHQRNCPFWEVTT